MQLDQIRAYLEQLGNMQDERRRALYVEFARASQIQERRQRRTIIGIVVLAMTTGLVMTDIAWHKAKSSEEELQRLRDLVRQYQTSNLAKDTIYSELLAGDAELNRGEYDHAIWEYTRGKNLSEDLLRYRDNGSSNYKEIMLVIENRMLVAEACRDLRELRVQ